MLLLLNNKHLCYNCGAVEIDNIFDSANSAVSTNDNGLLGESRTQKLWSKGDRAEAALYNDSLAKFNIGAAISRLVLLISCLIYHHSEYKTIKFEVPFQYVDSVTFIQVLSLTHF